MKRRLGQALLALAAVLVLAVAGFVIWGLTPLGPTERALRALEGDAEVRVTRASDGFEFSPRSAEPTVGLVFYPGGRVDVRSYAPLASAIASEGYLVVVAPMPLSLAVLSPNAADKALSAHPEISSWSVGGHSLGGAMAAYYAAKNPRRLDGLVLLAAYATGSADISETSLAVLDLYGSRDGVLDPGNHAAGEKLLPADRVSIVLEGANHAQFGDYGKQPGDNDATIPADEQQAITAEKVGALLGDAAR